MYTKKYQVQCKLTKLVRNLRLEDLTRMEAFFSLGTGIDTASIKFRLIERKKLFLG